MEQFPPPPPGLWPPRGAMVVGQWMQILDFIIADGQVGYPKYMVCNLHLADGAVVRVMFCLRFCWAVDMVDARRPW